MDRRYAAPKRAKRPAMSENYLEADVEPELSEEDEDDDAMRAQLQRQRYVDEDAEVCFGWQTSLASVSCASFCKLPLREMPES